jgi:hypothetical protein
MLSKATRDDGPNEIPVITPLRYMCSPQTLRSKKKVCLGPLAIAITDISHSPQLLRTPKVDLWS